MKLLLDIGNSSVNWAMEEAGQFITVDAFSYDKNNFEQDLQDNLLILQKPSKVLVANVAGDDILNCLDGWVKKQWQGELWQSCVNVEFNGLKNSYTDTQQMGIDRWLAMVAAWEKYQSTLCIVGCGTALTIDSIDSQGNHLGGYIIPGIELMQQALISKTECINTIVDKDASLEPANDTQAAINNGAFFAATAMIDRAVINLSNKSNSRPKCIISGGMAELISPLLDEPFEQETSLVLSGLLIVYKAST
jgi:type III pantothenate kinase